MRTSNHATNGSVLTFDTTDLTILQPVSPKHFLNGVGAADRLREFDAGVQQQLDGSRVISGFPIPAVLGAVKVTFWGRVSTFYN
jgi:hypothetical protein